MNPYFARLLSTFFKGFSEWNSTFHFTKENGGKQSINCLKTGINFSCKMPCNVLDCEVVLTFLLQGE